ncbi:MAG: hypothetical protein ACJ8DD_20995, partial [Microvirga sp.]
NRVLVRHCEDILSQRVTPTSPLRASVENAIAPLLHDPNAIDALRFGTRISFRWVATSKPRRSRLSGPPARQW